MEGGWTVDVAEEGPFHHVDSRQYPGWGACTDEYAASFVGAPRGSQGVCEGM